MTEALILSPYPHTPGRPMFAAFRGGQVYVYLHDAWYLKMRCHLRKHLHRFHPDGNKRCRKTAAGFRADRTTYLYFERKQKEWYAAFGMKPPDWKHHV